MPAADKEIVAVLDACVLLPASVRDTLLRLAETPRLYIPKWSDGVLTELRRNLELRWNLPPKKIAHLTSQLSRHFPEACVEPDEKLILRMMNDPKDRHVLAAAVKGKAEVIVTFNLKDFPLPRSENGKSGQNIRTRSCADCIQQIRNRSFLDCASRRLPSEELSRNSSTRLGWEFRTSQH